MILDRILGKSDAKIVTSAQLAEYLRGGTATAAGASVTPESAMRLAAVFACVRVLAESVGQLPCHLYKRAGRGVTRLADHPLATLLLDSPNPLQSSLEYWEMVTAHLATRGNHYALITRVRGAARELLPLNPAGVSVRLAPDWTRVYTVTLPDGEVRHLSAADVFHVPLLSLDGITGVSPITYAREAIGLGMATEAHGARLFSNGARPGGVLSAPGTLTDEAYKRIKESWEATHRGTDNAHRVAILEGGLTWAQVGLSAEDSQFLETRKHQRSEIAGIFRVPPHMIADLDRATFSNIESQGLDFVTKALMPYLGRIEARIRMQLLAPEERGKVFAKFNAGALARGDMAARSAYYGSGIKDGWLTRNEARELEERDPLEGLDTPLAPLNMQAVGEEPPDPVKPAAPGKPAAQAEEGEDDPEVDPAAE